MAVAFNKLTILAKSYLILSCDAVCTHHVARINMHEQLQYYSSIVNEGLRLLLTFVPLLHVFPPLSPHAHMQLMVTIGNDNANSFWEHHYHGTRLPADVEREIREQFIRAKYQDKSWIDNSSREIKEALSRKLCSSVKTHNLMRTMELLVHGADVSYIQWLSLLM